MKNFYLYDSNSDLKTNIMTPVNQSLDDFRMKPNYIKLVNDISNMSENVQNIKLSTRQSQENNKTGGNILTTSHKKLNTYSYNILLKSAEKTKRASIQNVLISPKSSTKSLSVNQKYDSFKGNKGNSNTGKDLNTAIKSKYKDIMDKLTESKLTGEILKKEKIENIKSDIYNILENRKAPTSKTHHHKNSLSPYKLINTNSSYKSKFNNLKNQININQNEDKNIFTNHILHADKFNNMKNMIDRTFKSDYSLEKNQIKNKVLGRPNTIVSYTEEDTCKYDNNTMRLSLINLNSPRENYKTVLKTQNQKKIKSITSPQFKNLCIAFEK